MDKSTRAKNRVKIAIIAIALVFVALFVVLIVQNIQLHKLEKQNNTIEQELSELEQNNDNLDNQINELEKDDHNKNYLEQEKNYGSDKDYIL